MKSALIIIEKLLGYFTNIIINKKIGINTSILCLIPVLLVYNMDIVLQFLISLLSYIVLNVYVIMNRPICDLFT